MQKETYDIARAHFNEPVLIGFGLCRVVGYAEDHEDCYLLVRDPRLGVRRCSMVGGYVFLDLLKQECVVKPLNPSFDGEEWSGFSRLDTLLELNGAPRQSEFILEEF